MVLSFSPHTSPRHDELDYSLAAWQNDLSLMNRIWEHCYHKTPEGLLRGQPLAIAEAWLTQYPEKITSTHNDFIQVSLVAAQEQQQARCSHWNTHIDLICTSAEQQFAAGEELLALREMVRCSQIVQSQPEWLTPLSQMQVTVTLQKLLSEIREIRHLEHDFPLTAMQVSGDGRVVAAIAQNDVIRLWRTADGADLGTISGKGEKINAIAFSPTHPLLAYTSEDSTLRLWNWQQGQEYEVYAVDRPDLGCLQFSQNGTLLAAFTTDDAKVHLWHEKQERSPLTVLENDAAIQQLCFSPKHQLIVTRDYERCLKVWNARTGQFIKTLTYASNPCLSYRLEFSPDGQFLATVDQDHRIILFTVVIFFRHCSPLSAQYGL